MPSRRDATSAYEGMHGHKPERVENFPIRGKDLENLWVLGRGVCIDYTPLPPSQYAGNRYTHYFGDNDTSVDRESRWQCPHCQALHFDKSLRDEERPFVGATPEILGPDGRQYQAIVIMGHQLSIGVRGIKG